MLKQGLKLIDAMKDELGRKNMKGFVELIVKTQSYLTDDGGEDKTDTKMCAIKRKLKFEDYKICLEATQLEKITNYLEKHEIDVYSLKEDHKGLIENNRLTLKTQQRFKNERHNAFTEEINKIALSPNDDKRMKSIDSIETKLATNS